MQQKFQVSNQGNIQNFLYQNPPYLSKINNQNLLLNAYQQVLTLQVNLINELWMNKNLINQMKEKIQSKIYRNNSKSTDVGTDKISPSLNKSSGSQNQCLQKSKDSQKDEQILAKKKRKIRKIGKKVSSGSCYSPSIQNSERNAAKTQRQTKHIPKNYGKAILNFMLKNMQMVQELCKKNELNLDQVIKVVQFYKNNVYTIGMLKSMWMQQQNKYAKIFRIFSMLYLRKFSLQHIFNSRVQNSMRHIKYRYRIMEAVKNPESFNRIKQY